MKKWLFIVVMGFALTVSMGVYTPRPTFAQGHKIFDVPQNSGHDREAIQKTIDEATAAGGVAHIPAGEYHIDGDLWLASNSILRGDGDASVLRFTKGQIRSLKDGSTNFYYTNNYINEVIPNKYQTTLEEDAPSGDKQFTVKEATRFQQGDWIYSDNNLTDTWAILEDPKRTTLWNDPNAAFARQEIFQVTQVQGNTLQLDRPLKFALKAGAGVRKHVGARNFEVSSLKVVNPDAQHPLIFEQPMNARFVNLTVEAKGGITLTHKPYNNLIENCRFITNGWRGITVEYFAAKNRIWNNHIDYVTGGDCALLVMFSSHGNDVAYNTILQKGANKLVRDEAGIYIHATSYENVVHHNIIDGTLEALGNFYSAEDNLFSYNRGTNVRIGIMSYYARNNSYINNSFEIVPKAPVDAIGALVYGSYGSLFQKNNFKGDFVDGIRIQGSHHIDVLDNVITGLDRQKSAYGINQIGNDKKTGDNFNGADPYSGLRRGNNITNVKSLRN